jgi:hypothetical protein
LLIQFSLSVVPKEPQEFVHAIEQDGEQHQSDDVPLNNSKKDVSVLRFAFHFLPFRKQTSTVSTSFLSARPKAHFAPSALAEVFVFCRWTGRCPHLQTLSPLPYFGLRSFENCGLLIGQFFIFLLGYRYLKICP